MRFDMLCSLEKLGVGKNSTCGIHIKKNENHCVFLISNKTTCYDDEVTNNVINYQGEGKVGDQTFTRKNKALQKYTQEFQNGSHMAKGRTIKIYKNFPQEFSQCVSFTKKGVKCNNRVNEEGGHCGKHGGTGGLNKINTLWECIGTFILVNSYMDSDTVSNRKVCIFSLVKVNNIPRPLLLDDIDDDE